MFGQNRFSVQNVLSPKMLGSKNVGLNKIVVQKITLYTCWPFPKVFPLALDKGFKVVGWWLGGWLPTDDKRQPETW